MDYQALLLQNKLLKPANIIEKFWKSDKHDPNEEIPNTLHDEAIASNPQIYKSGTEEILHMNSIDRLMRGNVNPDTALKQRIELEKKDMLNQILKESIDFFENGISGATGGVSTGAPIAPIASTSLTYKIENAYKLKKAKRNKK